MTTIRYKSHQRMLQKAALLQENGYQVVEMLDRLYKVTNAAGTTYVVDTREGTCECPAFTGAMFLDVDGRCTCKHLSAMQAAERRTRVLKNRELDF